MFEKISSACNNWCWLLTKLFVLVILPKAGKSEEQKIISVKLLVRYLLGSLIKVLAKNL